MTEIEKQEIVEDVERAQDNVADAAWYIERAVEGWMSHEGDWFGLSAEETDELEDALLAALIAMRNLEGLSENAARLMAAALEEVSA